MLRLVLFEGLCPALFGVAFGIAGSVAAAQLIRSMLYGTGPLDPAVFLTVIATLLAVASAACLIPAWRASRLDPMIALRTEISPFVYHLCVKHRNPKLKQGASGSLCEPGAWVELLQIHRKQKLIARGITYRAIGTPTRYPERSFAHDPARSAMPAFKRSTIACFSLSRFTRLRFPPRSRQFRQPAPAVVARHLFHLTTQCPWVSSVAAPRLSPAAKTVPLPDSPPQPEKISPKAFRDDKSPAPFLKYAPVVRQQSP